MSGRELPKGWETAKIGDLCDLVNGKAFKPSDWDLEGLPIIRIQNLNRSSSKFNYFSGDVPSKFLVEPGELLFAWSGTPGTSFGAHVWQGERGVLNQHIFRILFDEESTDKEFFRRAINHKLDELIGKAQGGVGLRHVTKGTFEETEVVYPPLPEQRRIVEKIEALTTRSRRAREALDSLPALIDRYRQSILAAAFRGDLSSDGDCGRQSMPVRELVAEPTCNGISIRGTDTPPGIPALRLNALTDQGIDFDARRYIPLEESRARRIYIRENDFFVSRGNGSLELVGRGALAASPPEEIVFPDTMIRIRLDQNMVVPEWFELIWGAPQVRKQIRFRVKTTAGIWKISQHDLSSITVDVPSIDVQEKEIRQIRQGLNAIEKCRVQFDAVYSRLATLDQSILAKAFRGELVPQDPNDEPASVLLERIRAERAAAGAAPRRGRRRNGA